jgi:Transmembrane secretion effector
LFTFLVGAGAALMAPPWQAVVPQLVPKHDLAGAVAANSIGFNVSRASVRRSGARLSRRSGSPHLSGSMPSAIWQSLEP